MTKEIGDELVTLAGSGSILQRRKILRFGSLITAFTGASALGAVEATSAYAGPADKSPSTNYVPTAEKGVASGVATLDPQAKIPSLQIPDLSQTYVQLGTGNETAIHKNAADKVTWTIGNAPGSAGFSGSGSPARALGALAIYQKFGDAVGGTNAPITNTTQSAYLLANYYGPTVDDSAEAFSTFVGIKNTGTLFTQTKPVTGFESIAQVESGNIVTGLGAYALGIGSRINVLGTGYVNDAFGFKATVNSSGGQDFGTIGRYIAYYQPIPSRAKNAWGVYAADPIQSEKSLVVARSIDTGLFKVDFAGSGTGNGGQPWLHLCPKPTGHRHGNNVSPGYHRPNARHRRVLGGRLLIRKCFRNTTGRLYIHSGFCCSELRWIELLVLRHQRPQMGTSIVDTNDGWSRRRRSYTASNTETLLKSHRLRRNRVSHPRIPGSMRNRYESQRDISLDK